MIANPTRRSLGMRPYVQGTDASALLGVRLQTDKTAGRMYAAYPNLANIRWLLPANQPALRRAGIEGLYQPNSLQGRALRTIIGAGALQGEKVWLEEDNLAHLETKLASVVGVDAVRLAFYLGVPAPHWKVTAQVLTPNGKTLAYAKIATSPLAQAAVKTERLALLRLSESAVLQGTVPEVLGSLEWHEGTILLITMGPARPGPRGLSSAHLRFCTQVFQLPARGVMGKLLRGHWLWVAAFLGKLLPEPPRTRLLRIPVNKGVSPSARPSEPSRDVTTQTHG